MGILLILLGISCCFIFAVSYICYRIAFFVPPRKIVENPPIQVPKGKTYEPYYEDMTRWINEVRNLSHEDVSITSRDGLRLTGKFYEFAPNAPVEIMFHGYRGSAERDLSGGVQRCFKVGRSALVVEQRCSNTSEGNVITFGVKEHIDCLDWVDFAIRHFGPDVQIILTGISMGASTVLMAAGKELPPNVIGILADCGFNSARDIIHDVIRKMGLPPRVCYPLVKLGARLFGNFDLDEYSAEVAMKNCSIPVIFFHGDDDELVPCEMSRRNFDACTSRKKLVLVPGAGHGLCYPVAPEIYLAELWEFFGSDASHPSVNLDKMNTSS